ncbi:hypothetical protein F4V43_17570 [Paenibacillus spiritus]|uniref:Right-handed parallel beta-helix repeat-containing protein n=1 Tax=Paenibacillus spiritus TaxID=2496557 RepID=A0A5J5FVB7_9BACL|nr:S-layer homology domain-containing protein [Paenibacillus spiritus]KAA8997570.1 hypothetical protein F4V43_17570 [Paenibacillus spiritus]
MKKIILAALLWTTPLLAQFPEPAQAAGQPFFSDISSTYWALPEIERLHNQKLIGGYRDGTFRPANLITRAEAVKLIVQAADLRAEAAGPAQPLKDVPGSYWAYSYIEAAQKSSIITGYADGSFRPGDTLTRADSAVIIARAFHLPDSGERTPTPSDVSGSHWAAEAISKLVASGIANGDENGNFQPSKKVTRSEFAALLARTLYKELRVNDTAAAEPSAAPASAAPASPEAEAIAAPEALLAGGGGGFAGGGMAEPIGGGASGGGAVAVPAPPEAAAKPPVAPTPAPAPAPSAASSQAPSPVPAPSQAATQAPSAGPTPAPSAAASQAPTPAPAPSQAATQAPSAGPTPVPSAAASQAPTPAPAPSQAATQAPSAGPTPAPSAAASQAPTPAPAPSQAATQAPSAGPTPAPSAAAPTAPAVSSPAAAPSASPSQAPAAEPISVKWTATSSSITLEWKLADQAAVKEVRLYLDGIRQEPELAGPVTFRGLEPATSYSLQVVAVDPAGQESPPVRVQAATLADQLAPAEISGFAAEAKDTSLRLSWSNPADADFKQVEIYAGTELLGISTDGAFTAAGLKADQEYRYTLRTVDKYGNRSPGYEASLRTAKAAPPDAPEDLQAAGGPSRVTLNWSPSPGKDVAGYQVLLNGKPVNQEPVADTRYTVSDLDFGTSYTFQVQAVDKQENVSQPSSEAVAKPTHYLIDLKRWGIYNDGTHPAETTAGINSALSWAYKQGITATTLPSGTYLIDKSSRIKMVGNMLFDLPDDVTLQKETNGVERYDLMYIGYGANNVTLRGGTYMGDRLTHDYSGRDPYSPGTHEGGYGIFIEGAVHTVVENVKAFNFTGDGLMLGGYGVMFKDLYASSFVSGSINDSGQSVSGSPGQVRTKDPIYLNNAIFKTENTFELSNITNLSNSFQVFFYKADGSFLKKQTASPRETMTLPAGAAYVHLVFDKVGAGDAYAELWNRSVTKNAVVRNSEFAFNRRQGITVGGADHALILNNVLHDIKGVAPQSGIDVEGGYGENGSLNTNITIKDNEFYNNAAYDVILYDGYNATVEGNHLASRGVIGLAVSQTFKNADVTGNHFDATRLVAYHDARFTNNRMNDASTFLEGPDIVVDGMDMTNATLQTNAKVPFGVTVRNVNITLTNKASGGMSVNNQPIEASNITITGQPALRSLTGGAIGNKFSNLRILDYNPTYGLALPPGSYTNSVFEPAEGSTFGSVTLSAGTYVFDKSSFGTNLTGNTALVADNDNLDLTVTNSVFNVKGDSSAVTLQGAKKVVMSNNVFNAMNLKRTNLEVVKIGNFFKKDEPSRVLGFSFTGNTVSTNVAGIGLSTLYAGAGAPAYLIQNNIFDHASMLLKANDSQSGNVQR